jgi:hypothetical protein
MAGPINLNRARKAKAKAGDKTKAAENRVRFGQAKADKTLRAALAEKAGRALDSAKREP